MVLMTAARAEMAKFYGLPNTQQGCTTDAKEPGPQAVLEKLLTTLPLVLSGADLVQGPGCLETSGLLCLEQIVVDEEIGGLCKRMREGSICPTRRTCSTISPRWDRAATS